MVLLPRLCRPLEVPALDRLIAFVLLFPPLYFICALILFILFGVKAFPFC